MSPSLAASEASTSDRMAASITSIIYRDRNCRMICEIQHKLFSV